MARSWPPVSVVIPVLNGEKLLPTLFASLKAQDYAGKLEIIIVDDDSTDKTVAWAKQQKARVVRNGQRHIERGKALGLKAARHELILFVDADNYFPERSWLRTAVGALLKDKKLVGAQSARFHYRASDPAANRYCSLLGINDPMAFYLKKRDRLTDWEKDWQLMGEKESDQGAYWVLRFSASALPTVGSQGFLTRKSVLKKATHWPYFFHMDANVELVEQGLNRYALLKQAVGHDHCVSAAGFVKKCRRNLDLFFKWRHLRRYTWDSPKGEFLFTVLSMVTVLRPLIDALRGFARRPDLAWFLHPVLCFWVPAAYTFDTLRHRLRGAKS